MSLLLEFAVGVGRRWCCADAVADDDAAAAASLFTSLAISVRTRAVLCFRTFGLFWVFAEEPESEAEEGGGAGLDGGWTGRLGGSTFALPLAARLRPVLYLIFDT